MLNTTKYKQAFLYFLNTLNQINGKKKSYKLFYFLDFDFYEAYEKSFTGETYKSLPMGPAPIYFDSLVSEMEKEGLIKVAKKKLNPTYENDMVIYVPLVESSLEFTPDELRMLNRIVNKYGNCTGTQLEKFSHLEAPYNSVELNQIIPYEYSFLRDTPDLF